MITSFILNIINFIWYGLGELVWPTSIAGFDLNAITTGFHNFLINLKPGLAVANIFVPLPLFFSLIILFITLAGIFLIARVVRFFIALLRPGV